MALLISAFGSAFVPAQPKLITPSGLGPNVGAIAGSTLAASAATLLSEPSTTTSHVLFSEPVGVIVFACAVSGVFLHFSSRAYEVPGIDEACVVQDEPICGPMSFDSVCASPSHLICPWSTCQHPTLVCSVLLARCFSRAASS